MLVGVRKKKNLPRSFETTWKLCHKLSLPTFSCNDILCNASFLTFAVMFSPLLMNFSLFLSYLSPVFHSFVASSIGKWESWATFHVFFSRFYVRIFHVKINLDRGCLRGVGYFFPVDRGCLRGVGYFFLRSRMFERCGV